MSMNLPVMFSTDGYAFPETYFLGLFIFSWMDIISSLDNNACFAWAFNKLKSVCSLFCKCSAHDYKVDALFCVILYVMMLACGLIS